MVDPGHGCTGADTFDPGAVGHIKEQEANLAIAKLVEEKLKAAMVQLEQQKAKRTKETQQVENQLSLFDSVA